MKCKSDNEQLRCPKCGSEMKHRKAIGVYTCLNEEKCFHTIPQDIIKHQQRLDNVLSNFVIDGNSKFPYCDLIEGIWIEYINNEFCLISIVSTDEDVISINTVESLLKDLKEE